MRTALVLYLLIAALALAVAPVIARADDENTPPPGGSAEDEGAVAGTADIVHLTNGKKRSGEVIEERATKIKIKSARGDVSEIKREEIARIDYKGRPSEIGEGDKLLNRGDADGAAKAYRRAAEAADSGRVRALWKPLALYLAGKAEIRAGRFAEAGAAFAEAVKAAPDGWYVREATREAVRAFARANDGRRALEVAEAAQAGFQAAGLPQDAKDEAKLLRAEALEAAGRAADAQSEYNLLTNSKDPKTAARAELGVARGYLVAKDADRAEQRFKKILEKEGAERAVRAGAARGIGDALLMRPGAKGDAAKLRAAAVAYAEAAAVHFPGRDDPTADREAALIGAAECYEALATLPMAAEASGDAAAKQERAKELFLALAQALRDEHQKLYPNAKREGKP